MREAPPPPALRRNRMLYHLYELQHAAVAPARFFADHGQHLLRNPFNPVAYTMPGRIMAAGLDLFEQTTRRYGKPKFGLEKTVVDGKEVAIEEEIVLRRTFGQLKHFRRLADRPEDPRLLRNPLTPVAYRRPGRSMAAGVDRFEQTTRRYGKPRFGLEKTGVDGKEVAIEEEIVLRRTFGQLKHFRRLADRPEDPRLLIVAPMSGHFATLLRGTVERMLPDHDVYITDWRDARDVPVFEGTFDLDDYVDYVIEFLRFLRSEEHTSELQSLMRISYAV